MTVLEQVVPEIWRQGVAKLKKGDSATQRRFLRQLVAEVPWGHNLKEAVTRNLDRVPDGFMFELDGDEVGALVSQNVIPGRGTVGGAAPMAFTE